MIAALSFQITPWLDWSDVAGLIFLACGLLFAVWQKLS